MNKLLDDAKAAGFHISGDDAFIIVYEPCNNVNITKELARFAALQQLQWISVTEKLPYDEIDVLVKVASRWHPIRIMKRVNVLGERKWVNEDNSTFIYDHFITNWMPLTEPPINTEVK